MTLQCRSDCHDLVNDVREIDFVIVLVVARALQEIHSNAGLNNLTPVQLVQENSGQHDHSGISSRFS